MDITGPKALKQSNGGPYTNLVGIKSEHQGKGVHFLDVSLSWRCPSLDEALPKREPVVLTWSIYEKRGDLKYSNFQMYRGIHHSTALTPHHQSLTIPCEGKGKSRQIDQVFF